MDERTKITIIAATENHIESCIQILQNSEIGKVYLGDRLKLKTLLSNAILEKGLFVAIDTREECLGLIYYMPKGIFGSYPYLHIIAVKEEYRNQGVGRQLMNYFEMNASEYSSTKYFLTVDDFNPRARRLYETLGYQCVGTLPNFYKKGIDCYLMMKEITR